MKNMPRKSNNLRLLGILILIVGVVFVFVRLSALVSVWNYVAAAGNGDIVAVRRYLDSGVPPDAPRTIPTGRAIEMASYNGHYDVVNLLLDRGANPTHGIRAATLRRHLDVVKLLVRRGADIKGRDKSNKSLMKFAEDSGGPEIVTFLRQSGAE
ncbi:MAG: ankyrin repeat domain-containing protein [Fibrella sp.]|nr:ankyrin repeat domain-containing protein [Armatimonadota bacterium]